MVSALFSRVVPVPYHLGLQGMIQMASPEAHALLGFNKNELKGKDLGIVLPPPFGEKHHVLVRNYIASGE